MSRPIRIERSWTSAYRAWKRDGYFHRSNGPAIEYDDGSKEWWDKGERTFIELGRSTTRRVAP